ncbi:50S ribosomal protein L24e [Candidatus Woesearchaeota archaeon]|nr:50S ribosomal protein L24e [Candidatus Woesearchaeota archaeon]
MVKCAFSGKEIPKGTGKMFVRKNGQILWFMNSKCQKNYLGLHRKPVNYKWTKAYVKGEAGVALKKAATAEAKAEKAAAKTAADE